MSEDESRPPVPEGSGRPTRPFGGMDIPIAPPRPFGGMDVPVPAARRPVEPADGAVASFRAPDGDLWASGHVDVLVGGGPSEPSRRHRHGVTALVAAGVAAVLAGGAALGWAAFNGDTGDQPEKHLPATAGVFVKADLAPSGAQKIDAMRFFAKVPFGKDLQGGADPKQFLYEQLTKQTPGAPPWGAVKPWLGDRAGLAVVPVDGGRPFTVGVLQVTDDAKAQAALDASRADGTFAKVSGGWAVVADSQAHLDAVVAATAKGTLADDATFRRDTGTLGDPGVLAGWVDGSRFRSSTGLDSVMGTPPVGQDPFGMHGAFVGRFSGGNAEVSMRTFGVTSASTDTGAGAAAGALPADTMVAVSVAGAGEQLKKNWPRFSEGLPYIKEAIASWQAQTGMQLPDDFADLLGRQFALAVGSSDAPGLPVVGVRAQSSSPTLAGALDRLLRATDKAGVPLQQRTVPGGYVLSTSRTQAEALTGDGGLGATAAFRDAVPEADGAQAVVYVDVNKLAQTYGSVAGASAADAIQAFQAVGLSVNPTSDGYAMTMRITTR